MTQPRDTADVIGSRGTAATADTGLLTGNVPTADDLSMVGETVNYTGANFQPEQTDGLGNQRILRNVSGATWVEGDIKSGANLQQMKFTDTGVIERIVGVVPGSWKSVAALNLPSNYFGYFVRVA